MKVRRGTPADVPRAIEIWRSAVDATHSFLSPADRAEIDTIVAEQFMPAADLWIAANEDDVAMGFMTMDGPTIDSLFVDSAVHGQGYGTMLVEHALTLEPRLRVSANEQATNAVSFYVARGFRILGRSPTDGDGRPYPLVHLER